jgi:hypothetical protein
MVATAGLHERSHTWLWLQKLLQVFAGEPLPAKLKKRKSEYVAGLKAADKGNLRPLQELVLECFQQQVADISLMPH